MTKIRKQKRKKRFRTNVNRKRLNKRLTSKGNIDCQEIKKEWEEEKSARKNLQDMGLCYDPNEIFKIPSSKQTRIDELKSTLSGEFTVDEVDPLTNVPSKAHVAQQLEEEAKAPRQRRFRLPKGQVNWITYLLDKYGEDYKAMERDNKNHYQETWRQLRAKVKTFKGIPEQYTEYLNNKNNATNCT